MQRRFKKSLTLKLDSGPARAAKLMDRLNAQSDRFPFSTPHALGLHILATGLDWLERQGGEPVAAPPISRTPQPRHNGRGTSGQGAGR